MAKLSTKTRKAMPAKSFALPGKKFPIENKSHARAAERDVGRAEKAGSITPMEGEEVQAKAKAKLGEPKLPVLPAMGKTHDKGAIVFDNNMKPFHHESVKHTSEDR